MPNINIRKLPDKTYKKIKQLAKSNGRSINNQVVYVLNEYSDTVEIRTDKSDIFEDILKLREKSKKVKKLDSVKIIREMRDEVG